MKSKKERVIDCNSLSDCKKKADQTWEDINDRKRETGR